MLLRLALGAGLATAFLTFAEPQPVFAQAPAQTPPASPAKPDVKPAEPAKPPAAQPNDPFGDETTLIAKPTVYVKGTGTWDKAFETITASFKTLKGFVDKQGLKQDGLMMTVFTSTDDTGFQFEASIPLAEPPKNPPRGNIAVGKSPEGKALKFIHRGSYDGLDDTYEAITNYLDEKRLEAKDMFIEEYVTDPVSTDEEKLVVNVFVFMK